MPLTLPIQTIPALYRPETRLALLEFSAKAWLHDPADWIVRQWLWRGHGGAWVSGMPRLRSGSDRDTRHHLARILDSDALLQTVIRTELGRMSRMALVPHEPMIYYFPDGVGILRPGLLSGNATGGRRRLMAATCLICECAEAPSAAIARHDAYTALLRRWGDVLMARDRAFGELRLPKVDILLPHAVNNSVGQTA